MESTLPGEQRLLRVTEVVRYTSLSRSKVYGMMDSGQLEYVRFGKARRVPLAGLERLVRENTVGTSN
jgi:excisionase family DNA binding protein